MKTPYACQFTIKSVDMEQITEALSEVEGFSGIQELADIDRGMWDAPEGLEVLEFGSESSRKFEDYVSSHKQELTYLDVFFNWEQENKATVEKLISKSANIEKCAWRKLENTDYLKNYKESVKGSSFGDGFWVGPPWDNPPVSAKHVYIIEPGMGFGTGEHPTTQMCLELIKKHITPVNKMLDLGCGSGVLSLALNEFYPHAKLYAVDNDDNCRNELEKSFDLNNRSHANIKKIFGSDNAIKEFISEGIVFDLIASNIYSEVLVDLMEDIKKCLSAESLWIVSGIAKGAAEKLFVAEAEKSFQILSRSERASSMDPNDYWISAVLQLK